MSVALPTRRWSPLRWLLQSGETPDPGAMARSGAFLYGSGGVLVGATVILSRSPRTYVPGIVVIAAIALAVAASLWHWRERTPAWIYPYLTAAGTVLITGLIFFDASEGSPYALLYVWAAIYAFYFYRPLVAMAQAVWIAVCSGAQFYLFDGGDIPFARWLMIVGTSVVAGAAVSQLVQTVRRLADLDGLTELANRRRMENELKRELLRAGRSDAELCVIMLDLDHFKKFNDEMGHLQADRHLKLAGQRWRAELREGDLIARYGGEEFAVVLPSCGTGNARAIADRLRQATPSGQTCSAGVARWDRRESHLSLLARADAALYEAKVAGRNRTVLAAETDPDLPGFADLPQVWAKMVPDVLEKRLLRFAYQPIVRLTDDHLVAFEALARPAGDSVERSVEGLFAAAQRLGFGRDLDWLCRRLCLERSRAVIDGKLLFLNIGVPALLSPLHSPDQMLLLLAYSGWSPREVVFEITERDVISDLDRFAEVLAEYRSHGFRFAIDDVGDGHSTLEVLARACPEYVKVARSLTHASAEPGARAAIRAVVAFAQSLESAVIAEGIESREQARTMLELGCPMGQGYALGRPAWRDAGEVSGETLSPLRLILPD